MVPSESATTGSHWSTLAAAWQRLRPPLRPTPEVVDAMRTAIGAHPGRTLQLGVTRELASISPAITAVDRNAAMIAERWCRGGIAHPVVQADWLAMPFASASFVAALGDGSLNALQYPFDYLKLGAELKRILRPGGHAVFRTYCAPDETETIAALREDLSKPGTLNFHAFKWRLAMAIVKRWGQPNIKVHDILGVFDKEFPDRAALADSTGWSTADIDTIDIYRNSCEVYSFPTLEQVAQVTRASFATMQVVHVGGYELAERCPLLVLRRGD